MLYHDPDGNWWLGTVNDGTLGWSGNPISRDAASPLGAANPVQLFGKINLTGAAGGDQLIAYDPNSGGGLRLGTFDQSALTWSDLLPPGPFPDLANSNGDFWCANFTGNVGSKQLLVIDQAGGGNWWLGTFVPGSIAWTRLQSDNPAPFENLIYSWTGDFGAGGSGEQVLIHDVTESRWFIGVYDSGALSWTSVASDASAPFGDLGANDWLAWANDFTAMPTRKALVYNPTDGNWWLGTLSNGLMFWRLVSNTTTGSNLNSDKTDVSYKVGAVGWPDGGVPGRGLEIALDPSKAFSFLQNILFDGLFKTNMLSPLAPQPLLGYVSVRVCPPTSTLMGMQQYTPQSIMIEIVGYRSPESDALMDAIQAKVISLNADEGLNAMLHWGLENQQLREEDLINTPLGQAVHSGSTITRLQAFSAIRQLFVGADPPVFDNFFTARLGL